MTAKPKSVDEYIALFAPKVQTILEKVRLTIRNAAPVAQETISLNLCGGQRQSLISTRSAYPLRPDRKNRETESEAEAVEGA
jgi:uncharacterized protein YdhG (YjbR/CyaY superfamily)